MIDAVTGLQVVFVTLLVVGVLYIPIYALLVSHGQREKASEDHRNRERSEPEGGDPA